LIIGSGGTAIITALQSGSLDYTAAPNVTQSITVTKLPQTLTFGSLPAMKTGDPDYPLTATSSVGLKVRFTSSDVSVALIEGSMTSDSIHVVGVGTTLIAASQQGTDIYAVATPITQTLIVTRGTTDLDELSENATLFYPNPVTDKLTISFAKGMSKAVVSIFSSTGGEMFSKEISGTLSEIDMSSVAPGLYIVKITLPGG